MENQGQDEAIDNDTEGRARDGEDGSAALLRRLRNVHGDPRYDIPRGLLMRWRKSGDPALKRLLHDYKAANPRTKKVTVPHVDRQRNPIPHPEESLG